ncbi:prefoldin subunit 1 [Hyalella azteca]|uniref:Prefoldin subunit 1 n=2 Tax=Hyalella azteca TaxID=294128 RepID=A0A8B7P6Y9_HYAAZ|nr:prefoldin subunit 1 [Hyalella azteca]
MTSRYRRREFALSVTHCTCEPKAFAPPVEFLSCLVQEVIYKSYSMADKTQPDIEIKRAFVELQTQMNETNQKLRIADVQVEGLKKLIIHSQLTDTEIQNLGSSVRVFESVGRMFLLTDIAEVRKNLASKVEKSQEKIKSLQSNKEYLEKSLQESQNNLREMIKLKQQTAS